MRIDDIQKGTVGSPPYNYTDYIIRIYDKKNVLQHDRGSYIRLTTYSYWTLTYSSIYLDKYTSSGETGDGYFLMSLDVLTCH